MTKDAVQSIASMVLDPPDLVADAEACATKAAADLATAQATLTTAEEELVVATEAEARSREAYHACESARLRTGNGDGSKRDTLRHAWTEARCAKESLEDVIVTLRDDVASARQAAEDAQARARQDAARAAWNSMVPQQHQAMARLEQAVVQAKEAVAEIKRLALAMAPHGAALGLDVDASLFQRRSLRFWLEYRVSELTGHRPDAAIHHWMQDESLANLNPFAHVI